MHVVFCVIVATLASDIVHERDKHAGAAYSSVDFVAFA